MALEKMIPLMLEGIRDTMYMTTVSTLFAYLLGLPLAIALVLTSPKGLAPRPVIYRIMDAVVNIFRSIPFLILMIMFWICFRQKQEHFWQRFIIYSRINSLKSV